MKNQKGYIDLDFSVLFVLAFIGIVAVMLGIPSILYWLFTHITIAFV